MNYRNNYSAHTHKRTGFQGCIPREIYAVQPINKGARIAFKGQIVVFRLILHIGKCGIYRFGRLIRQPKALEALFLPVFRRLQGVVDNYPYDYLTLAVGVSCIYYRVDILPVY